MATVDKNFKIKNGLIVGDSTNLVNFTAASPSDPFLGQLWIENQSLYAWSSASTWVLIGDGNTGGGGGGTASGTPFNIPNTLVARSASGSFQIGSVDFHTASPVATTVGRITWDDGSGTALLGLKGGNINLPIGQEEDALVYNGTGSALARGQVVRIVGAQGQRPRIDLAAAINDANSSKTFGIVAEPIVDGAEGFVTTFGIVNNINTAAFTEGASLWLSPSAGGIVSTMPIQPYHNVFIGYCLKSHASSGRIFVKIQNGYEIEELHDVLIQTASNNQIISYNSASSLWMNKDLQAAIKEVDGSGSGVDADLLDGEHIGYFQGAAAASATYLSISDAENTYIPISASSNIVENYIPVSSSYAYLTRSDAENTYIPISASGEYLTELEAQGLYIPITASSSIVSNYIPVSSSYQYLTRSDAETSYIPISASGEYLTETEAQSLYIPISASFRTFDAHKLDGFESSYFINSSSAVQEKIGTMTFHGTVNVENLVITGSATTISSTNIAITDSLIQLAHEQYTTDAVDIGIVGSYGDGTTSSAGHYHASFARDASQNKWKLLSNGPAPVNNVIDYSDPSVQFGDLQLNSIEILGSASSMNNISSKTFSGLLLGNAMSASSIDWSLITNKSITLGTDTNGNYVASATGGNGIIISGTAAEGWSPTITLHSTALTASVSGTSPTAAGSNGFRNITISTSTATGGNDGDVWLVYV